MSTLRHQSLWPTRQLYGVVHFVLGGRIRAVLLSILISTALLFGSTAKQKSYETVGKGIRKADLISLAYHQALKDFHDGIEVFHADISYGDLSGDGNEDAAVQVSCRLGPAASGGWSDVLIYGMRNGRPELITRVGNRDNEKQYFCSADICCNDCFFECVGDNHTARRLRVQRVRTTFSQDLQFHRSFEEIEYELRGRQLDPVEKKSTPVENDNAGDPCDIPTHR